MSEEWGNNCVCVYVCLFVSARVKSVSSTRKNLQQRSLINLLKVEGRSFVPLTNHPSSQPSVRSSIHSTVIHPFNCRPSYSIVSHPLNCQPPIHPADRQSVIHSYKSISSRVSSNDQSSIHPFFSLSSLHAFNSSSVKWSFSAKLDSFHYHLQFNHQFIIPA